MVQKYKMEKLRSKHFISFKLLAVLNSEMKSQGVQLCPAQNVNHPSVQGLHLCALGLGAPYWSLLGDQIGSAVSGVFVLK